MPCSTLLQHFLLYLCNVFNCYSSLLFLHQQGLYIAPTNGRYQGGQFDLLPKDPNNPDRFKPSMDGYNAGNWFDSDSKLLYLVIKGDESIDIITTPVIQVNVLEDASCLFLYLF